MDWNKSKSVEARIRRLTHEIRKFDDFFYGINQDDDRVLYAGMLERKRDDIVRSAVLQLHTVIEHMLSSWITCRVLGRSVKETRPREKSAQALRRMLWGSGSIGFDMKLNLALALHLINEPTRKQLSELNTLRNKCSHNWLLNIPLRRGKRPKQKKQPLLLHKGRDLHKVEVLEEFAKEYGLLYAKLFAKYVS